MASWSHGRPRVARSVRSAERGFLDRVRQEARRRIMDATRSAATSVLSSPAVRMRAGSLGWRTQLERVLAARYWILGTLAAAFGVMAGGRGDWNVFVSAGRAMVGSDGLHVFERH